MIIKTNPTVTIESNLSSGNVDSFDMLENLIKNKEILINDIANDFVTEVIQLVSSTLYSTKDIYNDSISIDGNEVILDTSNFVTNMVENGVDSFDMKPGHLNSVKAKTNAQGKKYAVVPISKFKHGRYNWRDRSTGRFDKGSNIGGDVEFRIISENSSPDSWIHPGYVGNNFFTKVLDTFDSFIHRSIDEKIKLTISK